MSRATSDATSLLFIVSPNEDGKEYGLPRHLGEFREVAVLLRREAEVRDIFRQEAPGVVRSLATMATSAAKSSDRKWAFKEFFGLIRGTVIRDTALQNAIAHRERQTAAHFRERANLILAQAQKMDVARKHRKDVTKALRTLEIARKVKSVA